MHGVVGFVAWLAGRAKNLSSGAQNMDETSSKTATPEVEWTVLQEAYTNKLMATYQSNLYFFHQRFPEVFEKIMAAPLPAPFEGGPDGPLTIFYGRFPGS